MSVVYITGGAKRIGKGLTTRFLERGYTVGVLHRSNQDYSSNGNIHTVHAELTNAAQTRDSLNTLKTHIGIPDVLVSNAGIFFDEHAVDNHLIAQMQDAFAINTLPLVTLASWYKEVLEEAHTQGRIVAISSLGAFEVWANRIAYNVSKTALVSTVNSLARSLAPTISVNSVAPGAIVFPDEHTAADTIVSRLKNIPMNRYGTADDVFDAVWFFSTASRYITGQHVMVDGGYHLTR